MIQPELPHSCRSRKGKSCFFFASERSKRYPNIPATRSFNCIELPTDVAARTYTMAMPKTKGLPYLLQIAPELREQIYEELLHDRPSSLFHLLAVNRQISREVKPWMFRQPLAFDGQQSLYKWLASVDSIFLPDVVHIRIVLHDLKPDQIMKTFGKRLARASVSHPGPQPLEWPYNEAFDRELFQIRTALRRFTNLRSFTLLENTFGDPQPPYRMLVAFAALILRDLPLVAFTMPQRVRCAIDESRFPKLRQLQITDYESRQTSGFPGFLESFPDLYSLELCSGLQTVTSGDVERKICQKPTDPVGKRPALKQLVVCMYRCDERPDEYNSGFGLFELDILAVRKHAKPLKVFKLLCNRWVNRSSVAMQQFFASIQSSALSYIETGFWWTPLPIEYPKSIITIAIRFDNHYARFSEWLHEFSDAIDPMRSTFFADHPHLKEILLYLPPEAYSERYDYQKLQGTSKARCWDHRVQLMVFYRDCGCEHRHRGPFVSDGGRAPRRLSTVTSRNFHGNQIFGPWSCKTS
ncbi:hypothetical protein XANCAGTX0491_002357 [Xanthoria calcicola]